MVRRKSACCRSPLPPAETWLLAAIVVAQLGQTATAATDPAAALSRDATSQMPDQVLYLQVTLNQTDTGKLVRFVLHGGRLQADVSALREVGFALPDRDPAQMLDLDTLPGVSVRYQSDLQRVAFDAPLSQLDLDTTLLRPEQEVAPQASASPGVLLNYDLYASRNASLTNLTNLTASTEVRAFGLGNGVLSSTSVLRFFEGRDTDGWRATPVRLDTSWRLDLPERALTLQLGDFYSDGLDWSRSVRMAGIQIGRDYSLQPYRVTTPLPAFLGDAVVPSQVELYVDGLRQYSGQVAAGPFQLSTLPGINGAGTAQVVVTDAFGRVRTLDFSFYGTQQLLAKGLSEGGAGLGVLRQDYGQHSFSYGSTVVGTGTLRYGVSDRFTLEGHAEAGGNVANAGAGGLWLLGEAGLLSASYARGRQGSQAGGQTAFEYTWNNRRYNLTLGTQRTHGQYRDAGSLQGSIPVSASDHLVMGIVVPYAGSVSASYVRLTNDGQASTRYAGLFWSQTFGRSWSANLSINQNLGDSQDRSLYLSVSLTLDGLRRASVSAQRNGDRDTYIADVSKSIPGNGGPNGVGWRVQARTGEDGNGGLAEIGWQHDLGHYGLGIANQGGASYGYASASGSLVWMDHGLLAARDIDSAFGVVSTRPDTAVRLENRLIGTTNGQGLLLVTPLQPWQRNRISIDTLDLPADLRVETVERQVTPRAGAGISVAFAITQVRAATVILHDTGGKPLAVGSLVAPEASTGTQAVVGHDGETYLDDLQPRNHLRVSTAAGPCTVTFDYPAQARHLPRIGPLTCTPETAP